MSFILVLSYDELYIFYLDLYLEFNLNRMIMYSINIFTKSIPGGRQHNLKYLLTN